MTKCKMSSGTSFVQTDEGKESLTLCTKTWATTLPSLLTWEKDRICNNPEIDIVSLTRCLMQERELFFKKGLNNNLRVT